MIKDLLGNFKVKSLLELTGQVGAKTGGGINYDLKNICGFELVDFGTKSWVCCLVHFTGIFYIC